MNEQAETNGGDEPDELSNEQRAERIKAARERDQADAAGDVGDWIDPAELANLSDEQLLAKLPDELRDAIAAGEVPAELVLEKVRSAGAALGETPADEPDPTSAAIAEAHAAYLAAVAEALGPEAEIRPCAACSGLGYNPVELLPDQHRERCSECGGEGYCDTGSKVETQRVLPCEGCKGNGWKRVVTELEQPQRPATVVPVLPTFVPQPAPLEPAGSPPAGVVG